MIIERVYLAQIVLLSVSIVYVFGKIQAFIDIMAQITFEDKSSK